MLGGSFFVGVHMALTHGVTLGMVASYIPATEVEGIGRITGTCWSFTDFVFGARHAPLNHWAKPLHNSISMLSDPEWKWSKDAQSCRKRHPTLK